MSDFKRVLDDLCAELADSPVSKAFQRGYIKGKRRARFEIVIVISIIYFGISAIGHYA